MESVSAPAARAVMIFFMGAPCVASERPPGDLRPSTAWPYFVANSLTTKQFQRERNKQHAMVERWGKTGEAKIVHVPFSSEARVGRITQKNTSLS
jgi:hypothetical protein